MVETPQCPSAIGYRLCAVDLQARPTAVIRLCPARAETEAWLARTVRQLNDELGRQGVSAIEPLFVRHLDGTQSTQVEVGYLVSEPIEDGEVVVASGLPAGSAIMAVGVHPEAADDARHALGEWLAMRGFRPHGAGWQCVQEDPHDAARPLLDIVQPYRWR